MSCSVGYRYSSDPMLLWLQCSLATVALIQPLAWELPYAEGVALKKQKQTNEENQKIHKTQNQNKQINNKKTLPQLIVILIKISNTILLSTVKTWTQVWQREMHFLPFLSGKMNSILSQLNFILTFLHSVYLLYSTSQTTSHLLRQSFPSKRPEVFSVF